MDHMIRSSHSVYMSHPNFNIANQRCTDQFTFKFIHIDIAIYFRVLILIEPMTMMCMMSCWHRQKYRAMSTESTVSFFFENSFLAGKKSYTSYVVCKIRNLSDGEEWGGSLQVVRQNSCGLTKIMFVFEAWECWLVLCYWCHQINNIMLFCCDLW